MSVVRWALARTDSIRNVSLGINTDAMILSLGRTLPPEADQMLRERVDRYDSKAATYVRWQFGALIFGALSFLVWHIIEMIALTPEPPAA